MPSRPIPGSSGDVLTNLPSAYTPHAATGLLHLPRFLAKTDARGTPANAVLVSAVIGPKIEPPAKADADKIMHAYLVHKDFTLMAGDMPPGMPYGGVKDSGLGREGLRWAIDDMTEIRIMVLAQPG